MHKSFTLAAAALTLAAATPALAHHSFAMFDATKTVTLQGTVTIFQFTNPHSWLEIDLPANAAGAKHWAFELNNLVGLRRFGWREKTMQPGDRVTVVMHPMRDGSAAGQLLTVTKADGSVWSGQGGPGGARTPVVN